MPEDTGKDPQRIADNVKAFLQDPVVQGSLIGAGGGGLLGLARTDREFDSVLPYIIAGGLTGGFGGAAAKSVRQKNPPGPPDRTFMSHVVQKGGAGLTALAVAAALIAGGKKWGSPALKYLKEPFDENRVLKKLVGRIPSKHWSRTLGSGVRDYGPRAGAIGGGVFAGKGVYNAFD